MQTISVCDVSFFKLGQKVLEVMEQKPYLLME